MDIVYETIGDPSDPPLLLVMGLGMQLIHWDIELCERFAERGFHVIRFDNRDAGLSTQIEAPVPNVMRLMAGLPTKVPYLLGDMAADTLGLLDHLGIDRAHVVGTSMGGMIAQQMAIEAPERVLSLASMMSTTGDRFVGTPKLRVWSVLIRRAPHDRDAYIEYFARVFRMIGSPAYRPDDERVRELAGATYDRGHHPAGTARQLRGCARVGLQNGRIEGAGRPDRRDPWRGGSPAARARRPRHREGNPGRRADHDSRNGPRPAKELWPTFVDAIARNAERASERGRRPERGRGDERRTTGIEGRGPVSL